MKERLDGLAVGPGVWAMADQGTVSLGNFLTNVFLARALAPTEYGIYALIFGLLLVLNSFHASLVTYPLSVKAAPADQAALRRFAGGSLLLTILFALPMGAVVLGAAHILGTPRIGPWAVLALLLWQAQETTRRALMAHLRHRDALWGDTLSYLGQAALVWAFASTGRLTPDAAFAIMAFTSGMAAAVQAIQLCLWSARFEGTRSFIKSYWELGRWVLFSNVLSIFTIQAFPWTLAFFHGPAQAGALQALINLLGVSHPVMFSVGNLIVPAAARAHREGGVKAARQSALSYGTQGAALLLPYYAALVLWPKVALRIFYGATSPYVDLTAALRFFVLAYTFIYFAQVLGSFLNGLEESRSTFLVQTAAALAALTIGLPFAAWLGVTGACAGFLTVNLVRFSTGAFFVTRLWEAPQKAASL